MKGLNWSDNICTVGWTCIHGSLTIEDMENLLEMQPEGSFTPTWHDDSIHLGLSNEETLDRLKKRHDALNGSWGFYFQFPWKGSAALVQFLLLSTDIKMEPKVEEKARQFVAQHWADTVT